MDFDEIAQAAAKQADEGVQLAMDAYKDAHVVHEDDLTGALVGALKAKLTGQIGGIEWSCSILKHRRGSAAEERRIGADLLIHVSVDTAGLRYSKGVLVQAKRIEFGSLMSPSGQKVLVEQCRKMLAISSHAFVFDYLRGAMRCGAATRIQGSKNRHLYDECSWTSYRFFLELFRCPVGDPNITSARATEIEVPRALFIKAAE
jgi:hypothetical protein